MNMKWSRRITAFAVLAVIVLCMSGYTAHIPIALEMMGLRPAAATAVGATAEAGGGIGGEGNNEAFDNGGENGDEQLNNRPAVEKNESRYNAFLEIKREIEKKFDDIALKYAFIELNGGIHSILGKRIVLDVSVVNSVVKLDNGYLASIRDAPSHVVEECAENVVALYESLTERGIDFLYVNAPFKIDKYDTQLPNGLSDYTNSDTDKFLNILIQSNVPTVDLREEIRHAGLNHYDLFFRTDHHWTPEAGLWAAGLVLNKYLPQYRHGNADFYDISNYFVDTHEQIFLGSQGRRVGRLYGGLDDFSIVSPRFETELKVIAPRRNWNSIGSFMDACIDSSKLRKDYYANDVYTSYVAGYAGTSVSNIYGNGMKCLIIGDSFSQVIVPFISLSFSEAHRYDPRTMLEDITAYEYIEMYNPDVVIVLVNPWQILPGMFEYGR